MDKPRKYTEWNKSDREKQILYDITQMCNIKNNANESIYKTKTDSKNNKNNKTRLTDTENKFMVTKGKREDKKEKLRVGLIDKSRHIKETSNKDSLYSTGIYIQ